MYSRSHSQEMAEPEPRLSQTNSRALSFLDQDLQTTAMSLV
jgi:hypothetical protein